MRKWKISKSVSRVIILNLVFSCVTLSLVLLNTPHVTYDGWQYISSGQSIFNGTVFENYFFVRKPVYPIFVGLCLKLFNSLWVILVIQTFFFVAAIGLLIETVVNSLTNDVNKRIIHKLILLFVCWIILGSLPSFILQQNAILILFAIVARKIWKIQTRVEDKSQRNSNDWFYWISVAYIAFLIGLEVFLIIFLLIIVLTIKKEIVPKKLLFIALISSLLVLATTYGLNNLHKIAQQSYGYNISNLNDPFMKENFTKNLGKQLLNSNPPYTQKVIRAFLANLDLSPTVGWDGIYTEIYQEPGHPMRAFGLNHLMQQMPLCNKFPEDGVIAVREEFVAQFQGCLTPLVQVPAQIKPFLYLFYLLGWPLIVFMAVFGRSKQFLWLPGITLAVYALLGAGISRYGMVAYPAIIVAAYVNFTLHIKAREDREPKRD